MWSNNVRHQTLQSPLQFQKLPSFQPQKSLSNEKNQMVEQNNFLFVSSNQDLIFGEEKDEYNNFIHPKLSDISINNDQSVIEDLKPILVHYIHSMYDIQYIASGSFNATFSATAIMNNFLKSACVIKITRFKQTLSQTQIQNMYQQFKKEIEYISRFIDPFQQPDSFKDDDFLHNYYPEGIIRYYGSFLQDDKTYGAIMEKCHNTLEDLIKPKVINENGNIAKTFFNGQHKDIKLLQLFKQIIMAINFLHSQGKFGNHEKQSLIHNDLKPGNIMIKFTTVSFSAKIIDLGTLTFQGQQSVAGTDGYMPPNTSNIATPHRDIWALGVSFYKMFKKINAKSMNLDQEQYREEITGEYLQSLETFVARDPTYYSCMAKVIKHLLCISPPQDSKKFLKEAINIINNGIDQIKENIGMNCYLQEVKQEKISLGNFDDGIQFGQDIFNFLSQINKYYYENNNLKIFQGQLVNFYYNNFTQIYAAQFLCLNNFWNTQIFPTKENFKISLIMLLKELLLEIYNKSTIFEADERTKTTIAACRFLLNLYEHKIFDFYTNFGMSIFNITSFSTFYEQGVFLNQKQIKKYFDSLQIPS